MFQIAILLVMLTLMPACSFFSSSAPPPSPPGPVEQQDSSTQLERFARTAKVGERKTFTDEKYGTVTALAREYYYSASGSWCRSIWLNSDDICDSELAFCSDSEGNWKEVPLLWNGCVE